MPGKIFWLWVCIVWVCESLQDGKMRESWLSEKWTCVEAGTRFSKNNYFQAGGKHVFEGTKGSAGWKVRLAKNRQRDLRITFSNSVSEWYFIVIYWAIFSWKLKEKKVARNLGRGLSNVCVFEIRRPSSSIRRWSNALELRSELSELPFVRSARHSTSLPIQMTFILCNFYISYQPSNFSFILFLFWLWCVVQFNLNQ